MLYKGIIPRMESDFLKRDSKEHNLRKTDLQKITTAEWETVILYLPAIAFTSSFLNRDRN
ncbi:hypothetical protein A4D02_24860 [Niastella koreensis]|uniref:Uncharacterized protein n=1 Tax=Niastella koreensis TaxID=354356 RepID=A0ABX3P0Y9_9BACT|nr:hypothetical protein A4D02_24860 [Niastella koreensis]